MSRIRPTQILRGDKLQLTLSTNAYVAVPLFYGPLECTTQSFADRVELVFTPVEGGKYVRNIKIGAQRGVLFGLFPTTDNFKKFRSMGIKALLQPDGTYKTVLYRDTEGMYDYYYDNRTTDSEYADMAAGGR